MSDKMRLDEFESAIQEAKEQEKATSIVEELRKNADGLEKLAARVESLHIWTESLLQAIEDSEERLTRAHTVVFTPETIEHLKDLVNAFTKMLNKTLKSNAEAAIKKVEQNFNAAEQRMKEQTDRIVCHIDRIALPSMLCYVCLTFGLFLMVFFGAVWLLNTLVLHISQLQNLCYAFAIFPFVISIVIYAVRRWGNESK